ncbi:NEAT domain-containing protein [Lacticaseibacillus sp. GG6-2]
MMGKRIVQLGVALMVALGIAGPSVGGTVAVVAATTSATADFDAAHLQDGTYEIPYTVNKAGTDKPSLSSSFFTDHATVVVSDNAQKTTVTLHLQKYAAMVKAFKIGDQDAKITNATANTADLTFNVDKSFAKATVTATMNVLNMTQKADLVFATPLFNEASATNTSSTPDETTPATDATPAKTSEATSGQQPANTADPKPDTTTAAKTTDNPATTPTTDATTYEVAYKINKTGTQTPSLSNSFFTGSATVVVPADTSKATVTLHLQKYANMVKTFKIGEQAAKVTNATANTADLTFTLNKDFADATVSASMSVLNMNQKTDIVFAKALYPVQAQKTSQPEKTDASTTAPTDAETPDSTTTPADTDDDTTTLPTTDTTPVNTDKTPAKPANTSDATTYEVAYKVNKAGTQTPSLSNGFFTGSATVVVPDDATQATVTLHLQKFANMIKAFSVGDQPAKISNATASTADLTFTIDKAFADATVSASMSVLNMNQKADIVFAQALYPLQGQEASQPENTNDNPDTSAPTDTPDQTTTPVDTNTSTTTTDNPDKNTTPVDTNTSTTPPTDTPVTTPTDTTTGTTTPANTGNTPTDTDNTSTKPATTGDATTYEVAYKVNKAGTQTPSLSNSFFTGKATVVVPADATQATVTLHIQKFANMIKTFSIGDQPAKISNATASTADLTFTIDKAFADATVSASMSVLNMNQKADIVFAQALYPVQGQEAAQPEGTDNNPDTSAPTDTPDQTTTPVDTNTSTTTTDNPDNNTTPPTDTPTTTPTDTTTPVDTNTTPKDTDDTATKPATTSDATTYEVAYKVNKAGTQTPSLSNSFFTGSATVVVPADAAKATVTLHLQKYASVVKTFTIGDQAAKVSNATADTADLTFTINKDFANASVTAAMSVLNMDQKADIVFAQALYPVQGQEASQPENTSDNPDTSAPTDTPDKNTTPGDTNTGATTPTDTPDKNTTTDDTNTTPKDTDDTPTKPATTGDATTYEVAYKVNKAGTQTPSLSNSFFTGSATVVVPADAAKATVTLHLQKYASVVKTFSIGDQAAKVSNATADTADLTFTINKDFAKASVTAAMSVLNMDQKADIVFAQALYPVQKNAQPATTDTEATKDTDKPAGTDDSGKATTSKKPTTTDATTYDVAYKVNKAGTQTPSLANSFFTGMATVVVPADAAKATVTLHLQQFANTIKSFKIGNQDAKITNATDTTGDLTFTIDKTFAKATVTASLSVLNMNQKADIVFAKALYPVVKTGKPVTDTTSKTKPATTDTKTPATKPTTKPAEHAATIAVYQALAGKLSKQPSAASAFIASAGTAVATKDGKHVQVTIHTTGAEYIDGMWLLNQPAKVANKHGNDADLIFTLPADALKYALPATFNLTIPGGTQMTQSAFVLINLAIANARPYPGQSVATGSGSATTNNAATTTVAGTRHIFNADAAVQYVPYSVLNQTQSAPSTANNYFTHTAKVVKVESGYDVYLTVKETAGLVTFTPLSVNGGGILHNTHTTANGFDIWTYAFHIDQAAALNRPIPATIEMSVPIAGIHNATFAIWLAFNQTIAGGVNYEQALTGGTTTGLAPITIATAATTTAALAPATLAAPTTIAARTKAKASAATKKTATPKAKDAQLPATAGQATNGQALAEKALPKVQSYPFLAEIAAFVAIGLAIIGFALYKRHDNPEKKA